MVTGFTPSVAAIKTEFLKFVEIELGKWFKLFYPAAADRTKVLPAHFVQPLHNRAERTLDWFRKNLFKSCHRGFHLNGEAKSVLSTKNSVRQTKDGRTTPAHFPNQPPSRW